MSRYVLHCAGCGAPLDAPWAELVVICGACGARNLPGRPGDPFPTQRLAAGHPHLNIGGRTWEIEGRIADGESSVVYRGRWISRLGEAALIKILAAPADADLLRREYELLWRLQSSEAPGAAHFIRRLPRPIAMGLVETDRPRLATVYAWPSGFVHTLTEIGAAYPQGLPAPVLVWMARRLLELLGFVHRAGQVHGAITPDHILIHPRDHGAMLIGWSLAQAWGGAPLPFLGRPARWLALYGEQTALSPALDIAMACRCLTVAAGWDLPAVQRPPAIAAVLLRGQSGVEGDAWALGEALSAASAADLGPPAYHPLPLPGWD